MFTNHKAFWPHCARCAGRLRTAHSVPFDPPAELRETPVVCGSCLRILLGSADAEVIFRQRLVRSVSRPKPTPRRSGAWRVASALFERGTA